MCLVAVVVVVTSDNRCATKCYVLFIELTTRDGSDVILTDHCKSKVTMKEVFAQDNVIMFDIPRCRARVQSVQW